MPYIGQVVLYTPTAENLISDRPTPHAAVVGYVWGDDSADLNVMPPGKNSYWAEHVMEGSGPDTFSPYLTP